jgi:hypothetical protein
MKGATADTSDGINGGGTKVLAVGTLKKSYAAGSIICGGG